MRPSDPPRDFFLGPADHLLVVVAHPDDETFGCGSIVAMAAARGARVSIVCATRGEAGEPTSSTDTTVEPLGAIRERELRAAAQLMGAHHVELLDLVDSGFDGPVDAGTLCATDGATLAARVSEIVDRLQPTAVVTLDGSDGHRDHVHLRDAVIDALAGRGIRLELATIPNAVLRAWLDEKRESGESSAYHAIDPDTIGRPDEDVTFWVDTTEILDTRLAAIALHRSQRSPFEGLSIELRNRFLCADHFVSVDG